MLIVHLIKQILYQQYWRVNFLWSPPVQCCVNLSRRKWFPSKVLEVVMNLSRQLVWWAPVWGLGSTFLDFNILYTSDWPTSGIKNSEGWISYFVQVKSSRGFHFFFLTNHIESLLEWRESSSFLLSCCAENEPFPSGPDARSGFWITVSCKYVTL